MTLLAVGTCMKKYVKELRNVISVAFFLAIIITTNISLADSPPPLPNTFSGTIKYQDSGGQSDVPAGTLIKATINNSIKGSTIVTIAGRYSIDVVGTYDDDGKKITFMVDDQTAEQNAVFNANIPPPKTLDLVVKLPPTGGGGGPSGGGGGGGGGGGPSGENYNNIELIEKYEEVIYKDKPTSYRFKNASNPVMFVNITGNVNAGLIETTVEVLKGTSTLVKEAPPGTVYKNVNIWVGTSGFATSKNIKEATVVFRVENSWIDANVLARSDIKLVKWEGAKWITLETSEKMMDSTYTYFEGMTTSFSPFAITGIKGASSTSLSVVTPIQTTPAAAATTSETAPPSNLFIIIGIIAIIAIIVALYLKYK